MKHETYAKAVELQKQLDAREKAAKELREFLFKTKSWYADKQTRIEVDNDSLYGVPVWILREALNDWLTENPGRLRVAQQEFDNLPG